MFETLILSALVALTAIAVLTLGLPILSLLSRKPIALTITLPSWLSK